MKSQLRTNVIDRFSSFNSYDKILGLPRPFIDFCHGDILAALLFNQILYWSDRTSDPEGWIAKSYADWEIEIGMTETQVRRAINGETRGKGTGFAGLKTLGIETVRRRSSFYRGAATLHYRVNRDALTAAIQAFLDGTQPAMMSQDPSNEQGSISAMQGTYPESTSESTSENLIDQRRFSDEIDARKKSLTLPDSSETIDNEGLNEAIEEAWGTRSPATVQELRKTLLGLHPPDSEHHAANITPPVTAKEVAELADFFHRQLPDSPMPTAPHKIQDWVYRQRDLVPSYIRHKGHTIPTQVRVPPDKATSAQTREYLKKYYPDEMERLEALCERLDRERPPKAEMWDKGVYKYQGKSVDIRVPFPKTDNWNGLLDYLNRAYPDEERYVRDQMAKCDAELDQEYEAIGG